ncbi:MBL fold hydrolase [Sphingorhabdus lutea]|uniref:MBL fold hydrolase n=1 Tax=Sphingorhabdus lutea TaxID=1913578 RepID=A0A1L3JBV2_9SPHN|nr:ribonuclease J [Sphingorhabdus lutea]APG62602.1 MBL fold hydrolase [Sphingorhabdus lutea]
MVKPADELLFLALGGSGEIGMNVNLYGCQGKWIMVDLGLSFADPYYPGVDLVLPDLEFIEQRADDLLGIVLTHGHEDHIGAIPYLAADLGVPLYATSFTADLIRRKLDEAGLVDQVELHVVDLDSIVDLGPFSCQYIPLAHSIAEGNALLINTPHGRIFHTGDWKLDDDSIISSPATQEQLSKIGDEGVLALVCDSTNAFSNAESGSEGVVRDNLIELIKGLPNRILVTSFASNIARLDSLGKAAKAAKRQLCVAGRSLDRMIEVGQANGYLKDFPATIEFDEAMRLPRNQVMIIATGGQGEPRAALSRIASDTHPIKVEKGDHILFSSKQIPGNEIAIGRIQNALAEADVEMITEKQAHIHVSGHPGRPELVKFYQWLRPEILLPVHGEMRHMKEQAKLGRENNISQTIVQKNGQLLRLAPGKAVHISHERAGRLLLDGDMIIEADGATMNERRKLSFHGQASVAFFIGENGRVQGDPIISMLGVPLEIEIDEFMDEAVEELNEILRAFNKGDLEKLKEKMRIALRKIIRQWTGKKPVVTVLAVEA